MLFQLFAKKTDACAVFKVSGENFELSPRHTKVPRWEAASCVYSLCDRSAITLTTGRKSCRFSKSCVIRHRFGQSR